MDKLSEMKIVSYQENEFPASDDEVAQMHSQVADWKVAEHNGTKRLERVFKFKNFAEALEFTNQVGELAEQADHHPALLTEWGKVKVTWWTHKVKGLHRNDFVMAARTDELYS